MYRLFLLCLAALVALPLFSSRTEAAAANANKGKILGRFESGPNGTCR